MEGSEGKCCEYMRYLGAFTSVEVLLTLFCGSGAEVTTARLLTPSHCLTGIDTAPPLHTDPQWQLMSGVWESVQYRMRATSSGVLDVRYPILWDHPSLDLEQET